MSDDFQPRDELEREALALARDLHAGQTDKATGAPYVEHPMRVASQVQRWGGSPVQVAAALLHDALEDAPADAGAAARIDALDAGVLDLVEACSDHTPDRGPEKAPWLARKIAHLRGLQEATGERRAVLREVAPVVAADKIDALVRTTAALREPGADLWREGIFKGGRLGTLWYYASMVDAVQGLLVAPAPGGDATLDEAVVAADLQRVFDAFAEAAGLPDAGRDRDGLLRGALAASYPEGIRSDQRGSIDKA